MGQTPADSRLSKLREFLEETMARPVEVVLTTSYQDLTTKTQMGMVDLAWAPPFVAARLESGGLRVVLRGIRRGASTYRAALLTTDPAATLEGLRGKRATWVDPYSVSGCLLPLAFLKSKGFNPDRDFRSQDFAGSFLAAVERLIGGKADVTSVFAPPPGVSWKGETGLEEIAAHLVPRVHVLAFTDVAPNSGLVSAPRVPQTVVDAVRAAFKSLREAPEGPWLLEQLFQMDTFEDAPPHSYHALYRLAIASL
jgi:phosphonate transport system substrate-binding protein